MRKSGTEVIVVELPRCDFCRQNDVNRPAGYDGKTTMGPWAYMCEIHFKRYGVGLGIGTGQRLTLAEKKEPGSRDLAGRPHTYEQWLEQVDRHLTKMTGFPMSNLDFGDWASRDSYDAGTPAEAAAREILENELGYMD